MLVSLAPVELKGQRGKEEFQLVVPLSGDDDEEKEEEEEDEAEDEPRRRISPKYVLTSRLLLLRVRTLLALASCKLRG